MNVRITARDMVLTAIILAGLLDFCANWLAAHWLLTVGPFLIPSGTFLFALGFTIYDYIRRQHGLWPTVSAIALGFAASVLYSLVWGGGAGRVAVAGLVALACSGSTDLVTQSITLRWPIWRYVTASNVISLLVDTVVFVTIAFVDLPPDVRLHIIEGQYLAKIAMTLVSIPLVYGARAWTVQVTAASGVAA